MAQKISEHWKKNINNRPKQRLKNRTSGRTIIIINVKTHKKPGFSYKSIIESWITNIILISLKNLSKTGDLIRPK